MPVGHATDADAPAGVADGTQAIRRAARMLRALAQAGTRGASLAELARTERLARSTAHRILRCLVEEGFVEQEQHSRRYQVGSLPYELGLAVPRSALEVARWRPLVETVARRTGVTAYLMRRSGLECVCLLKAEGHSVIRVIPVEVGQRRPLGVGAGATALLAAMDEDSAERVVTAIAPTLAQHSRLDPQRLRAAVAAARREGCAESRGMVADQVFGLGMAIPESASVPSLAISLAAHQSVATPTEVVRWQGVLREEIDAAVARQAASILRPDPG